MNVWGPRRTIAAATPGPAPSSSTNVNVASAPAKGGSIWTASRVIALVFSVLEVVLLVRFVMKLLGANADQPLVSAIYGVTERLVAPFRGIFAQPAGTPVVEIAKLLSIVFFVLVAALVVAVARAVTGKRGCPISAVDSTRQRNTSMMRGLSELPRLVRVQAKSNASRASAVSSAFRGFLAFRTVKAHLTPRSLDSTERSRSGATRKQT